MNDLTILYYTANTIPDIAGQRVRDYLLKVTENKFPIISVSQKPINFGHNICVGEIGKSKYNCYKQILIGVKEVKTKYVACAEDDTLYAAEHFTFRPQEDYFAYETNMWFAGENFFWRMEKVTDRHGMWGCITTTKALLENLANRYSLYPTDPLPTKDKHLPTTKYLFWGEPGTHDNLYGMENRLSLFGSQEPTVVFLYRGAMGAKQILGRYNVHSPKNITYNLKPFGRIRKLWQSYWQ